MLNDHKRDARPIGVFDSGLGGLTAVRRMLEVLPGEDLIYFGDTGRVPYGGRSGETILKYARQDIRFLLTFDIKAVVVACGTVSATVLGELEKETSLPIIGVVKPAAARAAAVSGNRKIGLIGTQASIRSGAYERELRRLDPRIAVTAQACPLLVPLVEAGRISPEDPVVRLLLEEYLDPLLRAGVDTIILGCTHYPLLTEAIAALAGDGIRLIDPGAEAARETAALFPDAASPGHRQGRVRYFVSDNIEGFSKSAELFLQRRVAEHASLVDMDIISV